MFIQPQTHPTSWTNGNALSISWGSSSSPMTWMVIDAGVGAIPSDSAVGTAGSEVGDKSIAGSPGSSANMGKISAQNVGRETQDSFLDCLFCAPTKRLKQVESLSWNVVKYLENRGVTTYRFGIEACSEVPSPQTHPVTQNNLKFESATQKIDQAISIRSDASNKNTKPFSMYTKTDKKPIPPIHPILASISPSVASGLASLMRAFRSDIFF